MLVVAGLAYTVNADSEDEAEEKLLEFLTWQGAPGSWGDCKILKLWVSARQDDKERVISMKQKEKAAIDELE